MDACALNRTGLGLRMLRTLEAIDALVLDGDVM